MDNPARKAALQDGTRRREALAAAETGPGRATRPTPAITPAAKNTRLIPAAQDEITRAPKNLAAAVTARGKIPAKLPASDIDPGAKVAVLRPAAAACRWCCGCSRATRSTGCRTSSTPTCATTTNTARSPARPSSAASAGTVTWTRAAINVTLDRPAVPRVARALALLIEQINATPPAMPGDPRPVSYHLAPPPGS